MDSSEALSELGLSPPVSADAIRRAYLRSVRAHPPERDPEGFRRVRDAYELLKDSPWLWHADGPVVVRGDGIEGLIELPGVVRVNPTAASDGDLDGGATTAEPEPNEASSSGDDDTTRDEDSGEHFGPSEAWEFVHAAMQRGDYESAAERFLASMKPGEEAELSPWQVLECVLGLFEQGKGRRARELLERLGEWTEQRGLHPGRIGASAAARWQLLKELAALSGRVDKEVVQRLAEAVKNGQFASARYSLAREQKTDRGLRDTMQRHAPVLFAAAGPSAPEMPIRRAFRVGGWNYLWLLGFGAFQCVRWLATSETPETKTGVVVEQRKPEERAADQAKLLQSAHSQRISMERAIDESVSRGACNDVQHQWHWYVTALRNAGPGAAEDEAYKNRRSAALALCAELEKDLPERP